MLAALLIALSCLSLHTLGSGVHPSIPRQVTGGNYLLPHKEHFGGTHCLDFSKIPPRNASLGCHPLNLLPLRITAGSPKFP